MNHEELVTKLRQLQLLAMAQDYAETARACEKAGRTNEQYLAALVALEIERKRLARIRLRIKNAHIPVPKSLDSYDFTARKGVTKEQMARLATGDFVRKAMNIVLYGPFGVGKSHLASGLSLALCEAGYRCLFISTQTMVSDLVRAHQALVLTQLFRRLDKYDVIVLDELGYSPHSQEGADLFFQLISQRYERKSLIITTNLPYSEWDKVFLSPMSTAAAVDRIIHNCETYNVLGPSWRAETAKKRSAQQRSEQE